MGLTSKIADMFGGAPKRSRSNNYNTNGGPTMSPCFDGLMTWIVRELQRYPQWTLVTFVYFVDMFSTPMGTVASVSAFFVTRGLVIGFQLLSLFVSPVMLLPNVLCALLRAIRQLEREVIRLAGRTLGLASFWGILSLWSCKPCHCGWEKPSSALWCLEQAYGAVGNTSSLPAASENGRGFSAGP